MANCFNSCLGCGSSVVQTLIRVILMVSFVIMLFWHVFTLHALFYVGQDFADLDFPGLQIRLGNYLPTVYSISVSMVGIYGVYTRDPKYLKTFAVVVSLSAIVNFAQGSDASVKDWRKHSPEFQAKMTGYAQEYQWTRESGQKENKATKAWDWLQTNLLCCGLKGPKDWTQKWRHSESDIVPKTCCIKLTRAAELYPWMDEKCDLQGAYTIGCLDCIDNIVESAASKVVAGSIFKLVMACMALILAKQIVSSQLSSADAATSTTLDGAAYVHLPTSGRQVNFTKHSPTAPALYPSAQAVQYQQAPSAPPPKYAVGRT